MTFSEFEARLTQQFTFIHTPSPHNRWIKHPWLASLYFYLNLFKVHWFASRCAQNPDGIDFQSRFKSASFDILENVLNIGGQFQITGLEHLVQTPGSVVIIGNHMSSLETMILPCVIMPIKDMTFIIKDDLLRYPLIGHTLRRVEAIAVSRANPKDDLKLVLTSGVNLLRRGRSIVVFPQSTRNVVFNPQEFNSIGVKLAKKAGVPVIPLALKTDFWQNGKPIKDLGKIDASRLIHFEFGAPLTVTGNGSETHEQVINFITTRLALWQL